MTECSQTEFEFQGLFSREIIGRFDGGQITSDGGSLLLREVERRTGILRRFAGCFTDHREVNRIEHRVEESSTTREPLGFQARVVQFASTTRYRA